MLSIKKLTYAAIILTVTHLQPLASSSEDKILTEIMTPDEFRLIDCIRSFTSANNTDIAEAILFEIITHTFEKSLSDSKNQKQNPSFISRSIRNRPEYQSLLKNLKNNPTYESLFSKILKAGNNEDSQEFKEFLKALKGSSEYQSFLKAVEATSEYKSLCYYIAESQDLVSDILKFFNRIPQKLYICYCKCLPPESSFAKFRNAFESGIKNAALNEDSLKDFVEKGCSLDDGLRLAVKENILTMAHLFLKNGANPNSFFEDGEYVLSAAVKNQNLKMIKLLLFYKAIPTFKNRHKSQILNSNLINMLKSAPTETSTEIVETLLLAGLNPNEMQRNKYTPLHHAASKDKTSMALKLLEFNANPHILNYKNNSPLMNAVANSNVTVAQACLKKRMDLTDDETNYSFCQAEETAAINQDKEMQQILQNARNEAKQRTITQKFNDSSSPSSKSNNSSFPSLLKCLECSAFLFSIATASYCLTS